MSEWAKGLGNALKQVQYHYDEKNYSLPYDFLVNKVTL